MATSVKAFTYKNGFQQPSSGAPWRHRSNADDEDQPDYHAPIERELPTSRVHNHLGINVLRTWPTLYDGTNAPEIPDWFERPKEVDVLICGGK